MDGTGYPRYHFSPLFAILATAELGSSLELLCIIIAVGIYWEWKQTLLFDFICDAMKCLWWYKGQADMSISLVMPQIVAVIRCGQFGLLLRGRYLFALQKRRQPEAGSLGVWGPNPAHARNSMQDRVTQALGRPAWLSLLIEICPLGNSAAFFGKQRQLRFPWLLKCTPQISGACLGKQGRLGRCSQARGAPSFTEIPEVHSTGPLKP